MLLETSHADGRQTVLDILSESAGIRIEAAVSNENINLAHAEWTT